MKLNQLLTIIIRIMKNMSKYNIMINTLFDLCDITYKHFRIGDIKFHLSSYFNHYLLKKRNYEFIDITRYMGDLEIGNNTVKEYLMILCDYIYSLDNRIPVNIHNFKSINYLMEITKDKMNFIITRELKKI